MADLATMREHLLRDLHIDTEPSGSEGTDDVTKAIIESIAYNRRFHLKFTEKKTTIVTEGGKRDYTLPADFISLVSEPYIQTSTESYNKVLLHYRPMDWIEENEMRGTEWETAITTGEPRFYGIDKSTKKLCLVPIPDSSGHIVRFTYQFDPGTPHFKYTSNAWTYYEPGTLEKTIAATYTNLWFTEGYWLIYNRAAYLLWTRTYGGTEEATMRSQLHLQQWAEELARLRTESAKYDSPSEVRRWI